MEKITIVIPTYNESIGAKLLYDALTSTLNTEGFKYECLFVDDGSEDDTIEVINSIDEKEGFTISTLSCQKLWASGCFTGRLPCS